jgi:myosin V
VQAKAGAQVKDLLNRLNNAVKQRNAAREEALLAGQKLQKLEEDIESGALQVAGAVPPAVQPHAAAGYGGASLGGPVTPPAEPGASAASAQPL